MNEDLTKILKYLRLTGLLANWDQYMKLAQKRNFSHVRLLNYILEQEYKIKRENSTRLRLKKAHIPEEFVIETYPFDLQPNLNKKKILAMYDSFDYITKKRNIIYLGPSSTGKTGLATSFLIQAINRGYTGYYILFPDLVSALHKSIADHSEDKVINTFVSYDIMCIDELGYIGIEPQQVGLFFTLMSKRHKKKTTLIGSNLGFSEWDSFLKNKHLTAALIDRITEDSYVVNMKNCVAIRKPPIE